MTPHPKFAEEQEEARMARARSLVARAYADCCATRCSSKTKALVNGSKSAAAISSLKIKQ